MIKMLKQMIVSWSWSGALHRHLCDLTPIDMVLHPFRPCNALDFYIQCIYTQTHKSETPITMVSNPFGPCNVLQCKMHSTHVPYKHIYNKIQSNRATQPKKSCSIDFPLKSSEAMEAPALATFLSNAFIAFSPIHNFKRWQRGKAVENISYGGKSEIPEIRDSRDKKITRVTAHSLTGPSSLTDTVDDTGHMPRKWKSCPPLVVYLNLRPPGLSRCTVRLPILDWGRRRPTQRNHLPKKTQYCKCSSKRSENVVLSS